MMVFLIIGSNEPTFEKNFRKFRYYLASSEESFILDDFYLMCLRQMDGKGCSRNEPDILTIHQNSPEMAEFLSDDEKRLKND